MPGKFGYVHRTNQRDIHNNSERYQGIIQGPKTVLGWISHSSVLDIDNIWFTFVNNYCESSASAREGFIRDFLYSIREKSILNIDEEVSTKILSAFIEVDAEKLREKVSILNTI